MTETRTPAEQAAERYKSLRSHIFVPLSEVIPAGQVGKYADEITRLVKPELESVYLALLEAQADSKKFEGERNAVYRERAHLVALLAAHYPSTWDNDPANDWIVVYVQLPTGQASWHIASDDWELFGHVPHAATAWDGHTTEEKYERVRKLAECIPPF